MSEYSLYSRSVSPETLVEAISGLATSSKPLSKEATAKYIGKSNAHTSATLQLGIQLELIQDTNNDYQAGPEYEDRIRKAGTEQKYLILREALQDYDPFISFIGSLNEGYSPEDAARQVKALYSMDSSSLEKQFLSLGEKTDIIDSNGDLEIDIESKSLENNYVSNLRDSLKSEATARLFIEKQLGNDITKYLSSDIIEELVGALCEFEKSPRTAISSTGRAIEDFQRDIGNDYGKEGNYGSAHGIGQLTQELNREDWSMKRHFHGGNYLAGMRNPSGGHGYDPKTMERWTVTSEVALDYILASLHYIKSLYKKAVEDKQVL